MASILPCAAAVAIILFLYRCILYPLFLSPLAKIPAGHWSCHVTPFWILRARKTNCQNRTLHRAHLKHGPVVRIGPNELSVDGVQALRIVYQGGFEKDNWYSVFNNYGVPCVFSTLSLKPHSLRKRMVSNIYSKSHILSSPAAKAQSHAILFQRLLPLIQASTKGDQAQQGIDVFSTFLATTMDFIAAYCFGLKNNTNFLEDVAYRNHWLQLYLTRARHHFWPQEMPTFTTICKKFGLRLYPSWVDDANEELGAWNHRLCQKARSAIALKEKEGRENLGDEAVVIKAIEDGIDKELQLNGQGSIIYSTTMQNRELAISSEVLDHLLAGQETAGIALTYAAWHLSRSPVLQEKLRAELLTLEPSFKMGKATAELPDSKTLDALPILHAAIMETLRLHAPIPGPEPRRTPPQGCQLEGFDIPGGVRVAALGYTLHLDETVFPNPRKWDHTRWLESETSDEQRKEMHRRFWAFGSGGRMCLGSNFAMNEMKHVIAAIYTNFTTHIVNDEGIEQGDTYTARPVSEQLILRFEAVE
ncbi:hypothetical protein AK830_g8634 [Neonectria ditissima]|uniref:Uncharacterized protein n=1 Tax=Neonectria ditissima TaxID=78410 RepID=A0A0P7BDT4_9HYPO|nr:hypothetical protein AK830_g8634 [Neonectria ditissima]